MRIINIYCYVIVVVLLFWRCSNDKVAVREKQNVVSIENTRIKLSFNLDDGKYNIEDKETNQLIIENAQYTIAGAKSDNPEFFHSYEWLNQADTFGTGKKLIIHSIAENQNELYYEITLYQNENFIRMNWGIRNNSKIPLQVKKVDVMNASAYQNYNLGGYKVLDGESNDFQTRVWVKDTVSCKNNLLITFGNKGELKNSMVIGGLTYHEFEKFTRVIKKDNGLQLTLWSEDPVGKRVDSDSLFISTEDYFLNFSIRNRFEILEDYGRKLAMANHVDISGVDFPIINFWYAYVDKFGGDEFKNTSTGTLEMLQKAYETGFGKYAKIGVRLEPDDYSEPNNQQGWWDDKHWQMYEGGQLLEPLATMEKWANAIHKADGEPLIYFQTNRRSEDYALTHPDHMLFNETHKKRSAGMGGWWRPGNQYWGYDFTDPGFIAHMKEVYQYLKASGIKGIKYDYPLTGWAYDGGFEDPYATTASAYRKIYALAYHGLGNGRDIHERMGPSDITLGVITTQRTEGDNDIVIPPMTAKTGLRWYKNRVVYHADQDARNPYRAHPEPVRYAWQAMYTMTYVTSGRMEIGKYFHKMSPEMLYDLSRVIPLHQTPQSARPIDAFSGKDFPEIYDFKVNNDWHLLTFYNTYWSGDEWPESWSERLKDLPGEMLPSTVAVELGAATDDGGLGLNQEAEYYCWDFWEKELVGIFKGHETLKRDLLAGEASMMALHKVAGHPQFISTNRHIMQGYLDLVKKPVWNEENNTFSGTSEVPADEEYTIVVAGNGKQPKKASSNSGQISWRWIREDKGLFEVVLLHNKTGNIEWEITFM